MEVKNPENVLLEITPEELLGDAAALKNNGLRLSQICCAYVKEKLELSYSFADDRTNEYITLRIVIEKDTEICSITELYPYAFLYENEMKELFGVNIYMINRDYQRKLYRIPDEAPFIQK